MDDSGWWIFVDHGCDFLNFSTWHIMNHHDITRGCIYVGRLKWLSDFESTRWMPRFVAWTFRSTISIHFVGSFLRETSWGFPDFPTGFFRDILRGFVRRNFVLRRTIWGIPWSRRDSSVLPMKHQDPDEDGWYLPCMVILGVVHCCFFPLTSIIFTGIIEITYNLFIFMAVIIHCWLKTY